MEPDESKAALREELRQVDADLGKLRRTAAELRQRVGERWDGPTDEAEHALMITAAEEQEAFAAELENRRGELVRRLGAE